MRLVDANLLVYARVSSFRQHEAARRWLDGALNGVEPLGLPWPSLLAFMRLVSNPRVFERPQPVGAAWKQIVEWLDCNATWVPLPTENHRQVRDGLIQAAELRAPLVPDAHLAALATEHRLILCSTDGDFARFPALRWENPIG